MKIIRAALDPSKRAGREVELEVDRHTLAKLRWRGDAEDGREFGFDLTEPLRGGDAFYYKEGVTYVIVQLPEPVFEIPLTTPTDGARIGWMIGNLHFPLDIGEDVVYVPDDIAIRQMLVREGISFTEADRVFRPARHGHVH